MLTSEGRNHIRRYLAGYVPALAQSIAMGVGNRAESISDAALQLEVASSEVNLTTYDFSTNKLVYKAPIPEDFSGTIYEVGLYSLTENPNTTESGSRNLSTFDSAAEDWINTADQTDAIFTTTSTRVGADSLLHDPAASASLTTALSGLEIDLSKNSAADSFTFAFNVGSANTSSVRVRFLTDGSNFYDFNLGAQTAGYKMIERTKGSATVTGVPSWENIAEIQVTTTSGAGGSSSVSFDAIRIEDKDTINLDYVLIARKVLAAPVTKIEGMSQDIEFSLDVTLP